jgi:hypothetical protein
MRFTNALLLASVAWLGMESTGCNPGDFNSVLDQAPVVSFGTSGSSTGALSVLALPPPAEANAKVAARMLVSRTDQQYLAVADYDKDGKVALHEVTDATALANLGTGNQGIVQSAARLSDGSIVLGTPHFSASSNVAIGRISILTLTTQADGSLAFGIQPGATGTDHFGMAVATGDVTGQNAGLAAETVVVADDSVSLIEADGTIVQTQCPEVALTNPNLPSSYAYRPVAVGDLLAGGGDEIALGGQTSGQGAGMVVFLQFDSTGTLVCSPNGNVLQSPGPSISNNFGTSLAVGDYNGDGALDLAVGTPPDTVYVYFGPLDGVTDPSVTITSAAASTDFGRRVATFLVPGFATAQLLVSAPTAAGGQGRVMLFDVSNGASAVPSTAAVTTLFDSNQGSNFGGSNIGGLAFNTATCQPGGATQLVPWVSTNTDVLTFFAYPNGSADPRCFAQKK